MDQRLYMFFQFNQLVYHVNELDMCKTSWGKWFKPLILCTFPLSIYSKIPPILFSLWLNYDIYNCICKYINIWLSFRSHNVSLSVVFSNFEYPHIRIISYLVLISGSVQPWCINGLINYLSRGKLKMANSQSLDNSHGQLKQH